MNELIPNKSQLDVINSKCQMNQLVGNRCTGKSTALELFIKKRLKKGKIIYINPCILQFQVKKYMKNILKCYKSINVGELFDGFDVIIDNADFFKKDLEYFLLDRRDRTKNKTFIVSNYSHIKGFNIIRFNDKYDFS